MKLLTVGDSFTYGEELEDRTLAWPYLVANQLGYEIDNQGKPASSNTRSVRYVLEYSKEFDMVIVAWSHYARVEFADPNGIFNIWPGCSIDPYEHTQPHRINLIKYLTAYHDDNYQYRQYLINIILLQNHLKYMNKKFLMLDAFGNNNVPYRKLESNRDLLDQIDNEHYVGWPTETMMEWTYGTPQGPRGHFLEQGHKLVAEKINEHIRNIGWVS